MSAPRLPERGRGLRLLLVRLTALGDAIHVLPTLALLRQHLPEAEVGWVVEPHVASLLRGHPQVDRVHVVPRKEWSKLAKRGRLLRVIGELRGQAREMQEVGYDLSLDFQTNFRSGVLAWLAGAPRRIAMPPRYAKESSSRLFATETPTYVVGPEVHKIERNLSLLECLGLPVGPAPRPVIPEPEAARALGEAFAASPGPRAVLQAGVSAFGALKAWPEARFLELARGLLARGVEVYFAHGGGTEEAQARRLVGEVPGTALAPAAPDLLAYAAVLRRAQLFVGVDSGPLHLAAALGTPVLGLYGPKHPGTYGPYWPNGRVVRSGIDCSPCRHRRCPHPHARPQVLPELTLTISPCMERLGAEVALEAALERIAAGGDAR